MFLPEVVPFDWFIDLIKDEQLQAGSDLGRYIATLDIPDHKKQTLGMLAQNLVMLSLHLEAYLQVYNNEIQKMNGGKL